MINKKKGEKKNWIKFAEIQAWYLIIVYILACSTRLITYFSRNIINQVCKLLIIIEGTWQYEISTFQKFRF